MRGCGALRQSYGRIRSLTSIVVTQVEAPLQLKPDKAFLCTRPHTRCLISAHLIGLMQSNDTTESENSRWGERQIPKNYTLYI